MTKTWTIEEAKLLIGSARVLRSWGREEDAVDTAQAAFDTLRASKKDETYYLFEALEVLASLHIAAGEPERAIALAAEPIAGQEERMERLRIRVAAATGRHEEVRAIAASIRLRVEKNDAYLWENLEPLHCLERIGDHDAAASFRSAWIDAAIENGNVLHYHPQIASMIVPALVARGDDRRLAAAEETMRASSFPGDHSGVTRERSREASDAYFLLLKLVPADAGAGPWTVRDPQIARMLAARLSDHLDAVPGGTRAAIRADLARTFEGLGEPAMARPHWRDAYGSLRAHGKAPEDPGLAAARAGLERTRRALAVPMEQEEATTIVGPALYRAFPDRARRMMLEIRGWFWDAAPPASPIERRCSFCGRSLEMASSSHSSSTGDDGAWVSLCSACENAFTDEFANPTGGIRPVTDAVLSDVRRALQIAGSADADDALLALQSAAAGAHVLAGGPCSFCPPRARKKETRIWCGPAARICERCVADHPRIVAV